MECLYCSELRPQLRKCCIRKCRFRGVCPKCDEEKKVCERIVSGDRVVQYVCPDHKSLVGSSG